MVKTED